MGRTMTPLLPLTLVTAAAALSAACARGGDQVVTTTESVMFVGLENLTVARQETLQVGPAISGTLEAERKAAMRAEVGGALIAVNAEPGQPVARGAVLGRIDDAGVRDAAASAQSALSTAEMNLSLAQRNAERARALAEAGLWGVGVSLDYADPQRHDALRGKEGAHHRAMEALRILQEARIGGRPRVNLMITLMHDNFDDIAELAEFARGVGCSFRVQPYSILKTGDTGLQHPRPVAGRLLELRRRYQNFITNPVVLEKFDTALNGGVPGCVAGRYMLNIDPTGRVAKCPEDRLNPVGHILHTDGKTLVRLLKERHRSNTCSDCWYNCRSELEVSYTARGMFYAGMRNFFGR